MDTPSLQKELSIIKSLPDLKAVRSAVQRLQNKLENEEALKPYKPHFAERV